MATNRGLLPDLSRLKVAPPAANGSVTIENTGDATAQPVWEITGPGRNFEATSNRGETLRWNGTLGDGETLTIDTGLGTCVDGKGANRYGEFDTAPSMWSLPPGVTTVDVSMEQTLIGASRITVKWRPRRWLVF